MIEKMGLNNIPDAEPPRPKETEQQPQQGNPQQVTANKNKLLLNFQFQKEKENRTHLEYLNREFVPPTAPNVQSPTRIIPSTHRKRSIPSVQSKSPNSPQLKNLFAPNLTSHYRAPILELCDLGGLPIRRRGRGAPLELRIILFAMLGVSIEDRKLGIISNRRPLVEWLQLLWPSDYRRVSKHWPKLRKALLKINTLQYHLPDGTLWRPLAWHILPKQYAPNLNNEIALSICFPEGVADGPPIHQKSLAKLGATNGRAFNAAVAGRSNLYLPGRTWIPTPRNPRYKYGWTKNLNRYPVLTLENRRRLVFGNTDANLTKAWINEAWSHPGLVECGVIVADKNAWDPEQGVRGWRIIPTELRHN